MILTCPVCNKEFEVPEVNADETFEANCQITPHCIGAVRIEGGEVKEIK